MMPSPQAAVGRPSKFGIFASLFLLAGGLVGVDLLFPVVSRVSAETLGPATYVATAPGLGQACRLLVAALIGSLIVYIQRATRIEHPLPRSMVHAQVLLCAAGSLTMLIIGESLARAFGIAGAAAVIRFRTPVDDPGDITVMFLLMALGMAAGLGLFTLAGVGTLFLGTALILMNRADANAPRSAKLALAARGKAFPTAHVSKVFAAHDITAVPVEIFNGETATVRYRASLAADLSIDQLNAELLEGGDGAEGLKSVSWEISKKDL
jgi:hypothetical protein